MDALYQANVCWKTLSGAAMAKAPALRDKMYATRRRRRCKSPSRELRGGACGRDRGARACGGPACQRTVPPTAAGIRPWLRSFTSARTRSSAATLQATTCRVCRARESNVVRRLAPTAAAAGRAQMSPAGPSPAADPLPSRRGGLDLRFHEIHHLVRFRDHVRETRRGHLQKSLVVRQHGREQLRDAASVPVLEGDVELARPFGIAQATPRLEHLHHVRPLLGR